MSDFTEDCCFNEIRDHCPKNGCKCGCHEVYPEASRESDTKLREAADATMVWAIDLVPRPRDSKVWRCRGCSQRGEYPAKIQHGSTCPFGKIDAALGYQNTVSRMFVGPEAEPPKRRASTSSRGAGDGRAE